MNIAQIAAVLKGALGFVTYNAAGTGLVGPNGTIPLPNYGNTKRIRRLTDFYANADASALAFGVYTPTTTETAALNTTIGTSGKTAFGQRAVRLTTAAVNGSFAEVSVRHNNTIYQQSLAAFDPSLPVYVVIAHHAVNGGSRLKLSLSSSSNVTTAGGVIMTGDMYINGVGTTGDNTNTGAPAQTVSVVKYNMRSLYPLGTQVDLGGAISKIRLQAYQEGTSGITDVTILGVYQGLEKAQIHFGFDDGLKSVYDNVFPLFQARGIVGSIAVMGAEVALTEGTRKAYGNLPLMIKPEIDEMVAAGWEVTVHGTGGVSGLTYAQALALVQSQKAAVEALGYTANSDMYVLPGGVGNFTADADGEPIGFKAFAAAGFTHARFLRSAGMLFGNLLNGLGVEAPLFQNKLGQHLLYAPAYTIYETAAYAAKIQSFELLLQYLSTGGFMECVSHNVCPRAVFPSGQPYIADGYIGTVSINNDTSTETLEAMLDLACYYRDLGLIDIVTKRTAIDGIPKTLAERHAMMALVTS